MANVTDTCCVALAIPTKTSHYLKTVSWPFGVLPGHSAIYPVDSGVSDKVID